MGGHETCRIVWWCGHGKGAFHAVRPGGAVIAASRLFDWPAPPALEHGLEAVRAVRALIRELTAAGWEVEPSESPSESEGTWYACRFRRPVPLPVPPGRRRRRGSGQWFRAAAALGCFTAGALAAVLAFDPGLLGAETSPGGTSTPPSAAAPRERQQQPPAAAASSRPPRSAANPAPAATSGDVRATTVPPADARRARLVVRGAYRESWIVVREGSQRGRVVASTRLRPDRPLRVSSRRLWVQITDASGVSLSANGERVRGLRGSVVLLVTPRRVRVL